MIRIEKFIEYFPQSLKALYPDTEPCKDLAARLVAHHLMYLNKREIEIYLRQLFSQHGDRYEIFTSATDDKSAIRQFIQMVIERMPNGAYLMNYRAVEYISCLSDDTIGKLITYRQIHLLAKDHISLSDIALKYQIRDIRTIVSHAKKMRIEIKRPDAKDKKARFISYSDFNRLLQAFG